MKFKKNITKCNIEGTILEYQYRADSVNAYPSVKDKVYLGFGRVHSINGVIQVEEIKKHFWISVKNSISILDVSNLTSLNYLSCAKNSISILDVCN